MPESSKCLSSCISTTHVNQSNDHQIYKHRPIAPSPYYPRPSERERSCNPGPGTTSTTSPLPLFFPLFPLFSFRSHSLSICLNNLKNRFAGRPVGVLVSSIIPATRSSLYRSPSGPYSSRSSSVSVHSAPHCVSKYNALRTCSCGSSRLAGRKDRWGEGQVNTPCSRYIAQT